MKKFIIEGDLLMKLKDKVAIITGGANGIGLGIAKSFVKEGAKVVIIDLDNEAGVEAITELQKKSPDSSFIQQNLAKHSKLKGIVEDIADKYEQIDILVNNAHATRLVSIEDASQEDLDLSFDTGFYPTYYLMQAALPYLKESKGKIINFASGAGIKGQVNQSTYAAAKEAIRGVTRVAANEFGPHGINVNIISPVAQSEGMDEYEKNYPDLYKEMIENIPLRKAGDVEKDIGRVAVFLASEDSDYITGQTIMVDGGSIMLR